MAKDIVVRNLDFEATGKKIKQIMDEKGIPVKNIARSMSISEQAVYRWLYGETIPTVKNLFTLSQLLGVEVDDLLVGLTDRED